MVSSSFAKCPEAYVSHILYFVELGSKRNYEKFLERMFGTLNKEI